MECTRNVVIKEIIFGFVDTNVDTWFEGNAVVEPTTLTTIVIRAIFMDGSYNPFGDIAVDDITVGLFNAYLIYKLLINIKY